MEKGIHNCFLESHGDYSRARAVMIGVPMDFTVSFRPGSRFGPGFIREMSWVLESYSPYLRQDLADISLFDYGDLEMTFGNPEKSLGTIYKMAKKVMGDDRFPVFIGGEHLISLPVVRAAVDKHGNDLVLLHFDAHADLREEYNGESLSHATVIRQCAGYMPPGNIYQFGIRSGTREEFEWGSSNTHFYPFEILGPLSKILDNIKGRSIYVTMDIDVVDPAYAPGTGTPEPGGCTSNEIIEAVHMLRDCNVIGFDLVEVMPYGDPAGITGVLAAKIIREALLTFV